MLVYTNEINISINKEIKRFTLLFILMIFFNFYVLKNHF